VKPVEEMGSSAQRLWLIAGRKRHLKEEVVEHVSGGLNYPFGPFVLREHVGHESHN
jgi:hypothetical protein